MPHLAVTAQRCSDWMWREAKRCCFQLACRGRCVFALFEWKGSHWTASHRVLLCSCAVHCPSKSGYYTAQHPNAFRQVDRWPWLIAKSHLLPLGCGFSFCHRWVTTETPFSSRAKNVRASTFRVLNDKYMKFTVSGGSALSLKCGTLHRAPQTLQPIMQQMRYRKVMNALRFIDDTELG